MQQFENTKNVNLDISNLSHNNIGPHSGRPIFNDKIKKEERIKKMRQ